MRKSLSYYEKEVFPLIERDRGIFMTDSGAFSFMAKYEGDPRVEKEDFWLPYLEEYVEWLRKWKEHIFVAANLDLDVLVGHNIVKKWNKKYFEPLEREGLQIVYVAHADKDDKGDSALRCFEEYCKKYRYVGINQSQKKEASKFYQLAKMYHTRVHGFAWTELRLLKKFPFFSVDSTSWLSGVRYGTTYDDDGKNFRNFDSKHKGIRKTRRIKYLREGINEENLLSEERVAINQMNLLGWMGFRREYLKMANLKLHNKFVTHYERKRT